MGKGDIELGAHGGSLVLQVQVAQGYRRTQTSRRFAEKLRLGWVRDVLVSASVTIGAVLCMGRVVAWAAGAASGFGDIKQNSPET